MGIRQVVRHSALTAAFSLVRIQYAQLSGYGGTADAEDSKSSGEISVGSSPTIRIRLIFVSKLLKRKVIENKIRPKVITFNACCDLEPSKVGGYGILVVWFGYVFFESATMTRVVVKWRGCRDNADV